ncbi:MAG TPA: hypothetical protein VMN38_11720 [Sphingomicrobium sp.]|nr:hypothetical protein [Sphingomicrobium sp.]
MLGSDRSIYSARKAIWPVRQKPLFEPGTLEVVMSEPREVTAPDGSKRWVAADGRTFDTLEEAREGRDYFSEMNFSKLRPLEPDEKMSRREEDAFREKFFRETFGPPPLKGPWWEKRAFEFEQVVLESAASMVEFRPPVTGAQVKWAILQIRQDMIILASYLSSANAQLRTIRRLLGIVAGLLAIIVVQLLLP